MIDILKTVLPSPEQMEMVIEGMRNPMNSWDKSDSYSTHAEDELGNDVGKLEFFVGENDLGLMRRLANGGPVHAKYRRMLPVFVTINAPLYWWKEFDTYKVGTVANSCSTMHKIHEKEFDISDFSMEHLMGVAEQDPFKSPLIGIQGEDFDTGAIAKLTRDPIDILYDTVVMLNQCRKMYLKTGDKIYWWQMIQLLPSSYNQRRTVMLNYEVLHNIYISRKNHKLDEWIEFCKWIEDLPYSELITASYHEPVFAES